MAYAAGARAGGVTIEEGVTVTDIVREGRRVTGVVTDHGTIGCDILVNCAGLWAKRVGEMAGVAHRRRRRRAPVFPHREDADAARRRCTTLRDPDNNFYLKPDIGSFAIGGWEDGTQGLLARPAAVRLRPRAVRRQLDRLELFALPAPSACRCSTRSASRPSSTARSRSRPTASRSWACAPELDNFYVACGFTAGIAASGGAGEALANWIVDGDPGMDLWQFDVRRFGPPQAQGRYLEERAIEAYGAYYKIHWPNEEQHSARAAAPLAAATTGSTPRARSSARNSAGSGRTGSPRRARTRDDRPSFEGKPNWFDAVAREVAPSASASR